MLFLFYRSLIAVNIHVLPIIYCDYSLRKTERTVNIIEEKTDVAYMPSDNSTIIIITIIIITWLIEQINYLVKRIVYGSLKADF